MPTEIKMPKLSDTMEEGTILRWFKKPGEQVETGEVLAEVETDKADMELEADASGTLSEIRVPEGAAASVGAVIAVLDTEPSSEDGKPAAKPATAPPKAATRPSAPPRAAASQDVTPRTEPAPPKPTQRPSSASRPAAPPDSPAPPDEAPAAKARTPAFPEARRHDVSKLRLAVAKQMTASKRDVPHFYVTSEIDMSEVARLRASLAESGTVAERITFTHLLIRALSVALPRHPRVNASWSEGTIAYHDDINIGIAVAVEDGLIAPVLRRCQRLTLRQIAAAAGELVSKAQSGKFGGEEMTGATFTLSNLGMLDIEEFSAVITPPQAAILAVGAIKDRPVVRGGQLAVAKTMRVTLSADHRVLNGVEAGRFLEDLKRTLENPVVLVMGED